MPRIYVAFIRRASFRTLKILNSVTENTKKRAFTISIDRVDVTHVPVPGYIDNGQWAACNDPPTCDGLSRQVVARDTRRKTPFFGTWSDLLRTLHGGRPRGASDLYAVETRHQSNGF